MRIVGTHIWSLGDGGVDPHDVVHPDAIDGVSGGSRGLQVSDSWIQGRVILEDGQGRGSSGGHHGFLFSNDWVSNSPSAGFTFTASSGGAGIYGRRVDVRSWDNHNGHDRIDIVNGTKTYDSDTNHSASLIDVIDRNVTTSPPPQSAKSPAEQWQQAHPYGTWNAFFFATGGASNSPDSGSARGSGSDENSGWLVAVIAGLVALVVLVVLWERRRRRGSTCRATPVGAAAGRTERSPTGPRRPPVAFDLALPVFVAARWRGRCTVSTRRG